MCFPAREQLIEHRQIANDDGDHAEARRGFDHGYEARGRRVGSDDAVPEGEERHAAQIGLLEQA